MKKYRVNYKRAVPMKGDLGFEVSMTQSGGSNSFHFQGYQIGNYYSTRVS